MAYIGRDIQYGTFTTKQTLTADSSTTVFTLTQGVADANNLLVSIGGIVQEANTAYTAVGTVLTFASAPVTGDPVWVVYLGKEASSAGASRDSITYQTGVGDGTTTPFALSSSVTTSSSIIVTLNGVEQVPGTDFTAYGTVLTFTTATDSADAILIYYIASLAVEIETPANTSITTAKLSGTFSGTLPAWNGAALSGIPSKTLLDEINKNIAMVTFLRTLDHTKARLNIVNGWNDSFTTTTSLLNPSTIPMTKFTTGDSLSRGGVPTGLSDGPSGTISCWVKFDAGSDGSDMFILTNATSHFRFFRNSANKFQVQAHNASNTAIWVATSTNAFTVSSGLMHIMLSWNLVGGSPSTHLYVNGSSQSWTHSTNPTAGTIDYADTNMGVGLSSQFYKGDLGQFYFNPNYTDLSVQANREKFYNSGAVDMGADGSTPTGSQPIIFLNNPYDTFQNNLGSGGNFTESGQLVDGGYLDSPNTDALYSSTNFSNPYELIRSYGKELCGNGSGINSTDRVAVGQCLTLTNTIINSVSFLLSKSGSATGNAYAQIRNAVGTPGSNAVGGDNILATSSPINVSALSGTYVTTNMVFPQSVNLAAGNYWIGMYYDGVSSLDIKNDSTGTAVGENASFFDSTSGWISPNSGANDTGYYLYGLKNLTLTTKDSDTISTSPATAPTKGYIEAWVDETPASGTTELTRTLNTNSSSANTGWRVVISNTELSNSAGKVRVTLQASTATDGCAIDNVAIVERVGATAAGVTTPKEILFGGTSGVIIPVGSSITSDWTDFDLDASKDYLVIIDQSSSGGNYIRYGTSGGHGYYTKAATNSYNTASYPAAGTLNYSASRSAIVTKLETEVQQTINTDYIAEMSRDGGTTYSPAVLSRLETSTGSETMVIAQGEVSFTGDPSGTNMVGRIRTVNKDKVTVKGISVNWSNT